MAAPIRAEAHHAAPANLNRSTKPNWPVAGAIGSVGAVQVGSHLSEGDEIAVLVPAGAPRAVVRFDATAGGRLRPGQPVVLRFPAYPWTAYGVRRGRVVRVASELVADLLRIEI